MIKVTFIRMRYSQSHENYVSCAMLNIKDVYLIVFNCVGCAMLIERFVMCTSLCDSRTAYSTDSLGHFGHSARAAVEFTT